MDGRYVSIDSGEPHCAPQSRARFLQRRRRYDHARYWDRATHVRTRRLQRSARKSGRSPKPVQTTLDELLRVHRTEEGTGPTVKS